MIWNKALKESLTQQVDKEEKGHLWNNGSVLSEMSHWEKLSRNQRTTTGNPCLQLDSKRDKLTEAGLQDKRTSSSLSVALTRSRKQTIHAQLR